MNKLIEAFQSTLGESIPGVVGALLILGIGWLIATGIKFLLKKALGFLKLNDRIKTSFNLESGIANTGYFLVLLLVVLAVFNQLQLEIVSQPIQALLVQVFDFIPKLLGGAILGILAWLVAKIVKQIVTASLSATGIDDKIKTGANPLSQGLGEASYWFIWLLFLPAILGVLELDGLLAPVQSMVDEITGILPNILAAALIILVGWFVAKIVRDLVTNLLSATGIDRLGEQAGLTGSMAVSGILGIVAYLFVFVPAIIAGLNALEMSAIADPATEMLYTVTNAIPNILAALAILGITYFIAKLVAGIASQLLAAIGFDSLPEKIGFKGKLDNAPSTIAGKVIFFFMILFATVEAANRIGFEQFSNLVTTFIQFGSQVFVGATIIVIGLWLSNIIYDAMKKASGSDSNPIACLVRIVILGLVFAMGLRSMGLANDIVNMAFGLTLGAAAVAFALAFGIGGRDAAGKRLEKWFSDLEGGGKGKK